MKQKQFEPLVYWTSKLSHNGITSYKQFEHCGRRMHKHSLLNLVQTVIPTDTRNLNETQSRKTRSLCQKLAYYSGTRSFSSKKQVLTTSNRISNTHCPFQCQPRTSLAAFDHFLDYLRRTANAVFVWKKELGETGRALHFHIMLNNFIPYYIVNWKWKRLLINEGIIWPLNADGKPTESHYRIELPRSKQGYWSLFVQIHVKSLCLAAAYTDIFRVTQNCWTSARI